MNWVLDWWINRKVHNKELEIKRDELVSALNETVKMSRNIEEKVNVIVLSIPELIRKEK